MKQIQLKKNYLEIPLVDDTGKTVFTFRFDKTDENIKQFFNIKDEVAAINDRAVSEDFDQEKSDLKELMDGVLGAGTFDALYQMNPSIVIITGYFLAVIDYIVEDIRESQKSVILDKYRIK